MSYLETTHDLYKETALESQINTAVKPLCILVN